MPPTKAVIGSTKKTSSINNNSNNKTHIPATTMNLSSHQSTPIIQIKTVTRMLIQILMINHQSPKPIK
jgi:hypothetical protein